MNMIDKTELLRRVRDGKLSAEEAIRALKAPPAPPAPIRNRQEVMDETSAKVGEMPWQDHFLNHLLSLIGTLLHLEVSEIDLDAPVADMGLDSLSATEFSNRARQRFGIALQATVFFECRTIRDFHTHMVRHHATRLKELYRATSVGAEEPISPTQSIGSVQSPVLDMASAPPTVIPTATASVTRASGLKGQAGDPVRLNLERLWRLAEEEAARDTDISSTAIPESVARLDRILFSRPKQPDLEVCVTGQGSPILLLGGLMNEENIWHRQIDALSARFRLVIFNMPGCGRSGVGKTLSMDSIVDDILWVLDMLVPDQAVPVIGYSFGGMLGLTLLDRAPDRVACIALINSTARTLARPDEARLLMEELARCPEAGKLNSSVDLAVAARYGAVSKDFDLRNSLTGSNHAALVLAGGQDGYIERDRGLELAALLPNARFEEISEGGHFSMLTHCDDVNAHLLTFLTGHMQLCREETQVPAEAEVTT